MQQDENSLHAIESYLTAQRAFLLAIGCIFETNLNYPNTFENVQEIFLQNWTEIWNCNEKIATILEVKPQDKDTIISTASDNAIIAREMAEIGDLEKLAELE